MSIEIPTEDGVRQAFRKTIAMIGEILPDNTEHSEFTRIFQSLPDQTWQNDCAGITTLRVNSTVRLVRVAFTIDIDDHADGQLARLSKAIMALEGGIRSVVPVGATLQFHLEFPPSNSVACGERITCLARGVVRAPE